jgi:hypothetical protein
MSDHFPRRTAAVRTGAVLAAALVFLPAAAAHGQLRVATWNISNYSGDAIRTDALKSAVYGTYQGRSMAPDVFMGQEFTSQSAVNTFVNILKHRAQQPRRLGGIAV